MSTNYHEVLRQTAAELERQSKKPSIMVARLRDAADTIERAPEARRTKIAMALRFMDPRLVVLPQPKFPLSDAYPHVPYKTQARLVLGETPASVTGLTARDAHEYLSEDTAQSDKCCPTYWFLRRRLGAEAVAQEIHTDPASVAVARWIADRWADPEQRAALTKKRREHGPGGAVVEGSFLDRIDELRDEDLRPSVTKTFEAAGARLKKELEKEMSRAKNQKPLAPNPEWWEPVHCATLLNKPGDLVVEGKEMNHCVATYAPAVRKKSVVIVSLRVRDKTGHVHRSTVEIDRSSLNVRQHRGVSSAAPPDLNRKALDVVMKKWRAKKDKRMAGRLENPLSIEADEQPDGSIRVTHLPGEKREENPTKAAPKSSKDDKALVRAANAWLKSEHMADQARVFSPEEYVRAGGQMQKDLRFVMKVLVRASNFSASDFFWSNEEVNPSWTKFLEKHGLWVKWVDGPFRILGVFSGKAPKRAGNPVPTYRKDAFLVEYTKSLSGRRPASTDAAEHVVREYPRAEWSYFAVVKRIEEVLRKAPNGSEAYLLGGAGEKQLFWVENGAIRHSDKTSARAANPATKSFSAKEEARRLRRTMSREQAIDTAMKKALKDKTGAWADVVAELTKS